MDVIKEWVAAVEGHRLTAKRLVANFRPNSVIKPMENPMPDFQETIRHTVNGAEGSVQVSVTTPSPHPEHGDALFI